MPISTLLIDLDGTLYPHANGLWEAIADRMETYMVDILSMPLEEVPQIRREYFLKYGTTLRGLITHHHVDPLKYLAYVHDVPLDRYLTRDEKLLALLETLPHQKWIFTNSDKAHSQRVLSTLGIEALFEGIIDVTAVNYLNKPDPVVFDLALEIVGQPTPDQCVFLDDIPHNLAPAKSLGIHTVLVGSNDPTPEVDFHIPDIYHLPDALRKIESAVESNE